MSLYSIIDRSEQAGIQIAYKLKSTMERLARWKNHLTFMIKCRNKSLLPKGFRVSLPSKTKKGRRIAERTGQALLRDKIKTVRVLKVTISRDIDNLKQSLAEHVGEDKLDAILDWSVLNSEKVFMDTKFRQQRKFSQLLKERCMHTNKPPQRKGLVVNLSSYTLNQDEKRCFH